MTAMLAHRTIAVELAGPSTTTAATAQISSALEWRDANDARQLMVTVLVHHESGLPEVEHVVRHLDAIAAPHRDRPTLRVYCLLPSNIEHLIGQLAKADTQTPRIEVIRVLAQPLQPPRLAQLMREAASAESSLLQIWSYLELSSVDELVQLSDLLSERALDPTGQPAFRRFPVVEVPGSFTIDDADPIVDFWYRHPQVQTASIRSLHGRVQKFFRLFEFARLAHLGARLPHMVADHAELGDRDHLPAFDAWLRRRNLLTSEPYSPNAILEHDVDLLADSHECQSPVFAFAALPRQLDAVRSSGALP